MKTMYKTGGFIESLIKKVKVERETEYTVWINGNRCSKKTEYSQFWNTFDEAKSHLIDKYTRQKNNAELRLEVAKSNLIKLELMKDK